MNSASGQITWATSPLFGGTTNLISVIATDNGQPSLSATGLVSVVLLQTANAPTLAPVPNYTIVASQLVVFTNAASDNNSPPKPLVFSLGAGSPTNATVDPVTGVFQWQPTAAQAPGTNVITVIVTDNGTPPLSASQAFTVVVQEANLAPVLGVVPNQVVNALATLTVTNAATEPNIQSVTAGYSLVAAPSGMSITAAGVITWTPPQSQSPSTNVVTTVVANSNPYDPVNPQLSATNSFTVIVPAPPGITTQPQSQSVTNGASVTFTVLASGTAPLAYQWYFNGSTLPGQTSAGMTLAGVATNQAGAYFVVVTNAAGVATSSNALLSVSSTQQALLYAGDSVIANRSSYLQAGEVLLVRTNGTQELLTTELYDPYTVAFDASGNILAACYQTPTGDYAANTAVDGGVFKIDQYTLAVTEVSGYTNFATPFGVAVEPDGHILVADLDANTLGAIFRVDPVTGMAVVLSENNATYGTNFYWLAGIAVATNGGTETIYVTDHGDGSTLLPKVIAINPTTGAQTVVAQGAPFQNPDGLAVDPSGATVTNIYVADFQAGTIIQIGKTTGSWTLTPITTTPANTLQLPSHVAIDPVTGDLFVTDAMLPTVGNPVAGAFWRISRGTFQIESISSGGFFEQPRGLGVRH